MSDDERKTHIQRFYGKDDNSDAWIDVEMLDQLVVKGRGQKTVHTFLTDSDDMLDARAHSTKQVKNPEDANQYVEIEVWDKYTAKGNPGTIRSYVNDDDIDTTRIVETHKIINRDVPDDSLDVDKMPPSDPEIYEGVLGDKDESQYVYFEVVKDWQEKGTRKELYSKQQDTSRQSGHFVMELDNSTLLPPDEDAGNSDPPVRLDPLQWIVNVGWGGLAVEFGDKGGAPPETKP